MKQIFNSETISGQKALTGNLRAPQGGNVNEFVSLINNLPEIDSPDIFGLPSNIDRSVQRFNSGQVISQLKSLAAVSSTSLRFDKEKWTEALGPLCQLWNNLYKPEAYRQVTISKQGIRSNDPVEAFTYMEMMSGMEILENVNVSIRNIIGVLQGQLMLTPKIESDATQLMSNQVPSAWEKKWEGPENPTNWIRVVTKKGNALISWVQHVQAKSLLKNGINLSDLFHPETFLNAFRQRNSRIMKVAIDELKLVSDFRNASTAKEGTVILNGLWLQGSGFQSGQLTEV